MEDMQTLTLYIAVWNWQKLALMFLMFTLLFLTFTISLNSVVFAIVCFSLFIGCEYQALKRRKELFELQDEILEKENKRNFMENNSYETDE